jgi:hypothetical protein
MGEEREQNLRLLVSLNVEGKLASLETETRAGNAKQAPGFLDARNPQPGSRGRKLCGVYSFLKTRARAFASDQAKNAAAKRAHWTKSGAYKQYKASNEKSGSSFHRHIHHCLFCEKKKERMKRTTDKVTVADYCSCKRKFGSFTGRSVTRGSDVWHLVRQACTFIRDKELDPVAAEEVIVHEGFPVGTRFDFLAKRKPTGNYVLVSWKTGYSAVGDRADMDRTKGENGAYTSYEQMVLEEHKLQLIMEAAMLSKTHGIRIDEACVVYVALPKNKDGAEDSNYRLALLNEEEWLVNGKAEETVNRLITRARQVYA